MATPTESVHDPSSVRVVNLTPHDVTVRWAGGERTLLSEGLARVIDEALPAHELSGLPAVTVRVGAVDGLPAPEAGVVYLVSRVTAAAVPHRGDVVFPFGEVRDTKGRIVAVSALATWADRG